MIRRISKHNDLKDIIKSCPSGVIDDIYAIEYYIQGHNETIQASFTKTGQVLEVVLPSTDLETLPNGILMRRAFYKVLDSSYPDGYYNLQFEDNMNIWLGDVESEEPVIPDYVTEDELAAALGDLDGNTVEDYVVEVGHRVLDTVAETYATRAWVSSKRYASIPWVEEQGYITSSALSGYATETYVDGSVNYIYNQLGVEISSVLDAVNDIQDGTIVPVGTATQSWVQSQGYAVNNQQDPFITESSLTSWAAGSDNHILREDDVPNLSMHASQIWCNISGDVFDFDDVNEGLTELVSRVEDQIDEISLLDNRVTALEQSSSPAQWGSITGTITNQTDLMTLLGDYATQQWVQNRGYITNSALTGYATQSWVQQNCATQSWVQQQGYLDSNSTIDGGNVSYYNTGDSLEEVLHDLSQTVYNDYAEKTWVMNQGYLTSSDLSGYATQQWATNQFLEESKVWTGTQAQWNALTPAQKAGYTIALITQ